MQLSSMKNSVFTNAAYVASSAKSGGACLLSGVHYAATYSSSTAHKVADLSLKGLSSALHYTGKGINASKAAFLTMKSNALSATSYVKVASTYLASKAAIGGSYLASGAQVTALYASATARKATDISLKILSKAPEYASTSIQAVKNHPKIAMLITGASTVTAIAHRYLRRHRLAPVNQAPVNQAPVNQVPVNQVPKAIAMTFTNNQKTLVAAFLKTTTVTERRDAQQVCGNNAAQYIIANQIVKTRAAAL
jgi:hypothetical protein